MDRKLLCIADNSSECKSAILFAARRAFLNGGKLVILKIIEPTETSLLSSLGDAIIEELRIEAQEKLDSLAQFVENSAGIKAQTIIREGEIQTEIAKLIDEDNEIKTLFLAAGNSKTGPGPLVSLATRGALNFGKRKAAIMIIPSGLSEDEIRELAG